jgi:hypothetical protein
MALSDAERKAAQRARLESLGRRGRVLFLTDDEYVKVKAFVGKLRPDEPDEPAAVRPKRKGKKRAAS